MPNSSPATKAVRRRAVAGAETLKVGVERDFVERGIGRHGGSRSEATSGPAPLPEPPGSDQADLARWGAAKGRYLARTHRVDYHTKRAGQGDGGLRGECPGENGG
jgi:hypothetical protein